MTEKLYRVNEIFYSLQGEGRWAGRAAVFIRFSGCNLKCPFCDTDFKDYKEMTLGDIIEAVKPWKHCGFVVLTGGEPTLQVDERLVVVLHREGFYVAIETNGIKKAPFSVDWITVSPKNGYCENARSLAMQHVNEVKIVFDGEHEISDYDLPVEERYLQPCDTGDKKRNEKIIQQCIEFIKEHPEWRLSLQIQKIIHVR